MWSGKVGIISATKHRIDLKEYSKRLYQRPYHTGLKRREIVAEEMAKTRKANVIQPVAPHESQWASPFVLVATKDGSVRVCIEYGRLNAMKKLDSYPILRMDDCLDSLGKQGYSPT